MSQDEFPNDPFRKGVPEGSENPFRDNPYLSPELGRGPGVQSPDSPFAGSPRRTMISHVPVVAILMIVQGVCELLMGVLYVGLGVVMPQVMEQGMAQQQMPPNAPQPEMMYWVLLITYASMGVLAMVAGILHVVAGFRTYSYRSRILGVIALILGMVAPLFTCYCWPTSLALGIYGLICFLNADVADAFARVKAGATKQQVMGG